MRISAQLPTEWINEMAKPSTILVKLVSTADTGYYYVTKNPRTQTEKLSFRKYIRWRASTSIQGRQDQVVIPRTELEMPPQLGRHLSFKVPTIHPRSEPTISVGSRLLCQSVTNPSSVQHHDCVAFRRMQPSSARLTSWCSIAANHVDFRHAKTHGDMQLAVRGCW